MHIISRLYPDYTVIKKTTQIICKICAKYTQKIKHYIQIMCKIRKIYADYLETACIMHANKMQ